MMSSASIVILSYPDTVVRPAYTEFSSKVWPLFGVGGKHAVQAGHAALLLIPKDTSEVEYFDFGRYITAFGFGRVRSQKTDVELQIPIKGVFEQGDLINKEELLLWLERHPEKTHGDGRLVASVNNNVDYVKAKTFIESLISQGQIAYGAFSKGGSNCARFVTDALIASVNDKSIKRKLKTSNLFTPSPIGNVIKGGTDEVVYKVCGQEIEFYQNRSVLTEYYQCFFQRFSHEPNQIGTEFPDEEVFHLSDAYWLGGIGSGAWFQVCSLQESLFVRRYTSKGVKDFEGEFVCENKEFNPAVSLEVVYPSNCHEVYVKQKSQVFKLSLK